ncbi:hypothetical protein DID75_02130 [Candidatus Marinamargulisbacteria bacterium SCGC AG-410-N11]|nr:hypothetical protein DID75_02130 [Candidatus Marinamargulisbacteria bacterium SCGC AG-410-N11]
MSGWLTYPKTVTKINLFDCNKITNTGLAHLSNLTSISLWRCWKITAEKKQELRDKGVKVFF